MRKSIPIVALALMALAGTIDLNNLDDYANQAVPNYITEDNTPNNNAISDLGATLGRVLFYDKSLSVNNTIACASCHLQEFAFGDTAVASQGVNGTTGRHSMRLINARFAEEGTAFWDERAASFEIQATLPIQDHGEMGFSGTQGDPDLDSLIRKMQNITYYPRLFDTVYGDSAITESRMQMAIAQFVRSIQSFDSKYDVGRANAPNDMVPFTNFTADENAGKALFLAAPTFDPQRNRIGGGAGCGGCHRAPEFDIDPNTDNNGVIDAIGGGTDLTNTRSPSLRDVFNGNGELNGPLMHTGSFATFDEVLDHYDDLAAGPGLDPRLAGMGLGQNLALTNDERNQLTAFLKTLTGSDVYTNPQWSSPFDGDSLTILPEASTGGSTSLAELNNNNALQLYPNPAATTVFLKGLQPGANTQVTVFNLSGQIMQQATYQNGLNISALPNGHYLIRTEGQVLRFQKIN